MTTTATPAWRTDTLEGHAGNALQMQISLGEGLLVSDAEKRAKGRLNWCLTELADRMDAQGLREFSTARVRVVRMVEYPFAAVMEKGQAE